VGKRSLALCTSKGTFIVRFLLLDPAFKAAFSYALASLVSPKSPRRRTDQPNVKVGGQWEGLGDLIGEVWSDVVEACSSNALDSGESGLNFRTIDVQPGQSLSSQARQVWQVLAVQSETSSSGTTGTSNSWNDGNKGEWGIRVNIRNGLFSLLTVFKIWIQWILNKGMDYKFVFFFLIRIDYCECTNYHSGVVFDAE